MVKKSWYKNLISRNLIISLRYSVNVDQSEHHLLNNASGIVVSSDDKFSFGCDHRQEKIDGEEGEQWAALRETCGNGPRENRSCLAPSF